MTIFLSITPLTSLVSSLAALPLAENRIAQMKQMKKFRPAIKNRKLGKSQLEKMLNFKAKWKVSLPKK